MRVLVVEDDRGVDVSLTDGLTDAGYEVEAVADGQHYILRRGDLFLTGVGCIHAFYNRSDRTVRWLETQAPQPQAPQPGQPPYAPQPHAPQPQAPQQAYAPQPGQPP